MGCLLGITDAVDNFSALAKEPPVINFTVATKTGCPLFRETQPGDSRQP